MDFGGKLLPAVPLGRATADGRLHPFTGVDLSRRADAGLVQFDAAWRVGPATLVAGVENLFGLWYAGSIEANESFGRFYGAGPPASVSLGVRLTERAPAPAR